jgi:glycosyltransferase involved in cell wall biosynthesis
MKVTNALVSVIVVTNGSGGHLRKCLDSLKGQDYQAMETIVIDNSLDPNLAAEINGLPIREGLFKPAQSLLRGFAKSGYSLEQRGIYPLS